MLLQAYKKDSIKIVKLHKPVRLQSKKEAHSSLVGIENCPASWEDILAVVHY